MSAVVVSACELSVQIEPVVIVRDLEFHFANGESLWPALSFKLGREATGLVGRNGVGKSLLAQLLMRSLSPSGGSIDWLGRVGYLSQIPDRDRCTVAQKFALEKPLAAYQRVLDGSTAQQDFDLLESHWDLSERLEHLREQLNCPDLSWDTLLCDLSGGQQMRLRLQAVLMESPDYLILDEPSNHLDQNARIWLKQQVADLCERGCGVLVISHDRDLLNQMHCTLELTSLGIRRYGGGFDSYFQHKQAELDAGERKLEQSKRQLKKQCAMKQERLEKQQKSEKRGKAKLAGGGFARFAKQDMKSRGEKTLTRNNTLEQDRIGKAQQQLQQAKQSMEWIKPIGLSLEATQLPNSKRVIQMHQLSVGFSQLTPPILHVNELAIYGSQRIWLQGANGSGKSTLLKTLAGQLSALDGQCYVGVKTAYLDQQLALLSLEQSAVENFQRLAPGLASVEYRSRLAWLRLRRDKAEFAVKELSCGERLKVALACALLGSEPAQLLLLDEPNNHLDLESLLALESALYEYRGALILVSHDATLAAGIGIDSHWSVVDRKLYCS
ncbi:ATP-binding cassette domain-containing protein [Vibrio vulnificus]|uniref:ATP-binding cassette domain-containing protein n=1 Tax=Vibrio vulnificus TaxID=672 RepID=UPI00165E0782|nr:ATP-binding cassette domain-containing protein [Vibrio vulnificus]